MLLVCFVSVLAAAAAGAESARDAGRVSEGTLFWRAAGSDALMPAPVLETDVHIVVSGIVARARVRQQSSNPATGWSEGVYVFPLPDAAAVDRLRMRVGERSIEGVVRERAAAKAQYEGAKRAGHRASLVEEERPNVFTTSGRATSLERPRRRPSARAGRPTP
jgi:Ca-activated chloride channel homolog